MTAIKIANLCKRDTLIDLARNEQQVKGGGFYSDWQQTDNIQYFLDGYTAGDYNLAIANEDGKDYLVFTLNSLFLGTPGATTGKPGVGIYAL